jgi:hypothetical protein
MRPWLMMFKKDFRMSKLSLIGFCGLIVLSALFISMSYTYQRGFAISIGIMALMMGPIALYFPIHLILSMRQEWHRSAPVWLHSPISGYLLLLSKMAVGFIYYIASLVVVFLFSYWILHIGLTQWEFGQNTVPFTNLKSIFPDIQLAMTLGFIAMIFAGIYMSVWAALISASVQAVKNRWRKLSVLLGIIIFLIPTWGFSELYRLSFVQSLLHLGQFQIPIHYRDFEGLSVTDQIAHPTFYTSEIVFYMIVVAVVFYIAGWLLDKKVEV